MCVGKTVLFPFSEYVQWPINCMVFPSDNTQLLGEGEGHTPMIEHSTRNLHHESKWSNHLLASAWGCPGIEHWTLCAV